MKASDLLPPNKICLIEDNDAWQPLPYAEHPFIVRALVGTPSFRLRPAPGYPDAVTKGEYIPSANGTCYAPTGGLWYMHLPVAGSSPAQVCFVITDCASPESAHLLHQYLNAVGSNVNIASVGGAAQSGIDVAGQYAPIVMSSPAAINVNTTPTSILAANVNRRYLYVRNTSTSGSRISLAFGVNAVLDSGITLAVGEYISGGSLVGVTQQAVSAIAYTTPASVSIQEGE